MRFANRVVVITGAAGGIGQACAEAFLSEGASCILADIDEDALTQATAGLPQDYQRRIVPVVCDVGNTRQVQALMQHAADHFGTLDVVVTAAGIAKRVAFHQLSEADFDASMRTNLKGPFLCVQAACKVMAELRERERDILGSLVMISADASFSALLNTISHAMAAGGVAAMVRHLARPLAGAGLRINAVAAGPTETRMLQQAAGTAKAALNPALSSVAQGRVVESDEIARIVLFLSSGEASAITGQMMGTGAD